MERIESDRPILDPGVDFCVIRADHPVVAVTSLQEKFALTVLRGAKIHRAEMELKDKRVLVIGLARTGVATALFCAARGARVTATESRPETQMGEAAHKLRAAGVSLEFGGQGDGGVAEQDLVVPSPGVPADAPLLMTARKNGVAVWSEIELAYRFLQGTLIGITGSNGKTTTTSLIAHILETAEISTLLAGNIGIPLISCVERTSPDTVTVAELSSFQLELVEQFRPRISVFLNLTPDHLDRHGTMDRYAAAKAHIFENQTAEDFAVINADDPATRALAPSGPAVYWFSRMARVEQGSYLRGDEIVFCRGGKEEVLVRRGDIALVGGHNLENVLAAVTAARLTGASAKAISEGVRTFAGVEHRLEFVAEIGGVRYYNDSKATNVDATLKALEAFPGHVLIILGGKDKGSDYPALREPLREKATFALLIGAAAEKIEAHIVGSVKVERSETLERAVETASHIAQSGDIVLLAPACASFDQFENYEHRGRTFKELVRQIETRGAATTSSNVAATDTAKETAVAPRRASKGR
jgi:UDP-N-acetylmuramoylalanine--D-glutamate ligase